MQAYRLAVGFVYTSLEHCNAWPTLNHWIASRIRTNCSTHFTLGRNTGIPDRVILPTAVLFFLFCFAAPSPPFRHTFSLSNVKFYFAKMFMVSEFQ